MGDEISDLLVNQRCSSCGCEITSDSIRYEGTGWTHKSPQAHPQAGHHRFNVLKSLPVTALDLGWTVTGLREHATGELVLVGERVVKREAPADD